MADTKLTIQDLVKQASANLNKAAEAQAQAVEQEEILKTAAEQGMNDAERVMKVASITGDAMGTAAFNTFHDCMAASLGFDPEDAYVKTAAISDMLDTAVEYSLMKIAEVYSSQTGGENLVTTQMAAADQVVEQGKANAMLAAQAAQDAIASADMGDANTAAQSITTAGQNITLAQQALVEVPDPELQAQVQEASQIVAEAATALQDEQGAPVPAEDPYLDTDIDHEAAAAAEAAAAEEHAAAQAL